LTVQLDEDRRGVPSHRRPFGRKAVKFYPSVLSFFMYGEGSKRQLGQLVRFVLLVTVLVLAFSFAFHFLMAYEGKDHSWLTGLYWTLTVMTTLGFGDITFQSDLGRVFSILVLLSGVILLLTLLPFTFIKFFYAPWMEAESRKRAPRELPPGTQGHVILTSHNPVTVALIEMLVDRRHEYVLIVEDIRQALELHDAGVRVAIGNIDDPETYRKLRVDRAAMVIASNRDEVNTNIAFTVRELSERVPILTTADSVHSEDILQMAGSTRVLNLYEILGRSLATWTVGGDGRSNIISEFDGLVLAEFPALETPLVGGTLSGSQIRENFGLTVVGLWERGLFSIPDAGRRIDQNSVLVLAGSKESLEAFNDVYSFYHVCRLTDNPVLIVGGGRVGRSVAARFRERGMPYLIIEKNPRRVGQEDEPHLVVGDAADLRTLQKAWIQEAHAGVLTTHDDATNIYLTKYLRSLRPQMQILSRATQERNVSTLHRAGADFVMSYASLGANAMFNFLKNEGTLMLAEGLDVFRLTAPKSLVGKTLAQSGIRERTSCSVVALKIGGELRPNPDPHVPIPANAELVLIGNDEGQKRVHLEFNA
jgi:Trk K+ transport system NAD-binding subunit